MAVAPPIQSDCPDIINPAGAIGQGRYPVVSSYGARLHPITNVPKFHAGIDIGAPENERVNAVADGTIRATGNDPGGYGDWVDIRHNDGTYSRYAHLARIDVDPQQEVLAGDRIGLVGSTGGVTGPHLHFELRNANFDTIDPEPCYLGARLSWTDPNWRRIQAGMPPVDPSPTPEVYAPSTGFELTMAGKQLVAAGAGLGLLLLIFGISKMTED